MWRNGAFSAFFVIKLSTHLTAPFIEKDLKLIHPPIVLCNLHLLSIQLEIAVSLGHKAV